MSTEGPAALSPAKAAIAISMAVFVGVTSIFVAVMACAIAPIQMHTTGITGNAQAPSNAARWSCYAVAIFALANGVFVLRSGRKNFSVAMVSTTAFIVTNVLLCVLYLRTW